MSLKIKLKNFFRIKPKVGERWRLAKDGVRKISFDQEEKNY